MHDFKYYSTFLLREEKRMDVRRMKGFFIIWTLLIWEWRRDIFMWKSAVNFYFKMYKKYLKNISIFQIPITNSSYFESIFYRNLPTFMF